MTLEVAAATLSIIAGLLVSVVAVRLHSYRTGAVGGFLIFNGVSLLA